MHKTSIDPKNHVEDFPPTHTVNVHGLKTVFWLTTTVMVLEITVGTWSGSMALLADGWHMGTHSAAFAITFFAYWYAKKHTHNEAFNFGTGKVTYLGGFASAIALALVALMMVIESIQRLLEPQVIQYTEAIWVAIFGLIVNVVSVFLLHDHGHQHDHNMKAAYYHVLADTLTSMLAIVALLAGKYIGLIWVDAFVGIVGAAVILRWSYGLVRESSGILLDKTVTPRLTADIASELETNVGTRVKSIRLWKTGQTQEALVLSIAAESPRELCEYKRQLRRRFPSLSYLSIEVQEQ